MRNLIVLYLLLSLTVLSVAQEYKFRKVLNLQTGVISLSEVVDENLSVSKGDTVVMLLKDEIELSKDSIRELYLLDTSVNHNNLFEYEGNLYFPKNGKLIKAEKLLIISDEFYGRESLQDKMKKNDTVNKSESKINGATIFFFCGILLFVVVSLIRFFHWRGE